MTLAIFERGVLFIVLLAAMFPLAARGDVFGIPLYAVPIVPLLALWTYRCLYVNALSPGRARVLLPFLLVAILMGFSTIGTTQGDLPEYFIWLTALILMFYANQNWQRIFDYRLLLAFAFTAALLEVCIALAQITTQSYIGNVVMYFGETGDIDEDIKRLAGGLIFAPVGTVGLPNMLGTILVMLSAILYPVAVGQTFTFRFGRVISIVLIALSGLIILSSGNRGNLVALVFLPVLFSFVQMFRTFRITPLIYIFYLVCIVAVLIIVTAFITHSLYAEQLQSNPLFKGIIIRLWELSDAFAFRTYLNWQAILAMLHYPLTGMGFSASGDVWDVFNIEIREQPHFRYRPHNIYLIVALEAGLIGGILFTFVVVHILYAYLINASRIPACIDSVYVSLVIFFGAGLVYISPLTRSLWPIGCLLIGIIAAEIYRPLLINIESHTNKVSKRG